MALKFRLYSRWGDFLFEPNVIAFEHNEEIDGQDYITFTSDRPFSWGDRIVWEDDYGVWYEHVVNESSQSHRKGETYQVNAINSFQWDTSLRMVNKTRWNGANLRYAVTELLKLSPRWTVGTVKSTATKNLEYERESCYDSILKTCGTFVCEIKKEITVDKNGVIKRTVSFVDKIGIERHDVRFDYGAGLTGVDKNILSDPVITACYGFGSGVDEEELWCYITNDAALEYWGLPDGSGKVMHSEGIFTDPEIEDMATLRQATTDYLNAHSAPTLNYTADIPFASLKGVSLGDTITLVDSEFTPEIRMYARIGARKREKVGEHLETTSVTFGQTLSVVPDALGRANMQEKVIIRQNETIGNLRGDLQAAQSDLESTRSSLSQTQTTLSQTQSTLSQTQSSLMQTQRDLLQAQTDLTIAQNNAAAAQRNADAANKTANDLAVTVTNQGKTIDSQEKTIASQSSAIEQLQSDVADLSDNLRRYRMSYANGYNAVQDICNTYLACCINGTPMTASVRNRMDGQYSTYNTAVNDYGILHNYGAEWMYQQLMALPVSDEGGEEPSIGDEPGEGPQIMEPDTSSDTDSDTDTTE